MNPYRTLYKPGDKVLVSVDSNTALNFASYDTGISIEVMVIGQEPGFLLLGFETAINEIVWRIEGSVDLDNLGVSDRVPNIDIYQYGFWADPIYINIVSKVASAPSHSNGIDCKQCQQYYPYAVPNQSDGTLICYGCKLFSA